MHIFSILFYIKLPNGSINDRHFRYLPFSVTVSADCRDSFLKLCIFVWFMNRICRNFQSFGITSMFYFWGSRHIDPVLIYALLVLKMVLVIFIVMQRILISWMILFPLIHSLCWLEALFLFETTGIQVLTMG